MCELGLPLNTMVFHPFTDSGPVQPVVAGLIRISKISISPSP